MLAAAIAECPSGYIYRIASVNQLLINIHTLVIGKINIPNISCTERNEVNNYLQHVV